MIKDLLLCAFASALRLCVRLIFHAKAQSGRKGATIANIGVVAM
jgi:hypothetical protein